MPDNYKTILDSSRVTFNFYYFSKKSNHILSHREDKVVETASTIKVLIMAYLFHEVEQGRQSLRSPVKVLRKDVGRNGSGIMQFFYLHKYFELYNLVVMMMSVSDNVATNVLIRMLDIGNINAYAQSIGLGNTKLIMEFLDFTNEYRQAHSPVGHSTPKEMAQLIERLLSGELLDKSHTTMVRKLLREIQESFIKRQLPFTLKKQESVKDFGSKTGWLDDADEMMNLAECGYLVDKNNDTHIFSLFLSAKLNQELPYSPDSENRILFAKLGRALYDELAGT